MNILFRLCNSCFASSRTWNIGVTRFSTVGLPKGFNYAHAKDQNAYHIVHNQALSGLPKQLLEKKYPYVDSILKPFVVLGIETSCDDTAVGIVRSDGVILANVVMSQVPFRLYIYLLCVSFL